MEPILKCSWHLLRNGSAPLGLVYTYSYTLKTEVKRLVKRSRFGKRLVSSDSDMSRTGKNYEKFWKHFPALTAVFYFSFSDNP